jgi:hypothetical protein
MAAHWTARPRFIFRGPGWVTSRGADPAPNVSVHVPRQLTSIAHSARPHGLDPGEEAHNARAAFELAATYDPIVIRQLGNNSARVNGARPTRQSSSTRLRARSDEHWRTGSQITTFCGQWSIR